MLQHLRPRRRRLQRCSQTCSLSTVAFIVRWSRRRAKPGQYIASYGVALCERTANATRCCCVLSRQREIEQVKAQVNRLANLQLRQPATAAGLEPLTEEQLDLATEALGPGPKTEKLASKVFKCAWPNCALPATRR